MLLFKNFALFALLFGSGHKDAGPTLADAGQKIPSTAPPVRHFAQFYEWQYDYGEDGDVSGKDGTRVLVPKPMEDDHTDSVEVFNFVVQSSTVFRLDIG